MKLLRGFSASPLVFLIAIASAASSWTFDDGSVAIQGKGSGIGSGFQKEKFTASKAISEPLPWGPDETLKVVITTKEDKTPKRPHQAFLTLRDPSSGLEESYPISVKDSGKAKVDLSLKDLPIQLLNSKQPLEASIILASFGATTPLKNNVFKLDVKPDQSLTATAPEPPVRYHKLDEIHHIFRPDPKSPPIIITLVFVIAALGTIPLLLAGWLFLGANLNEMSGAFSKAPISYSLFLGSIFALEGIFFLYYTSWNLFQILPLVGAAGFVAILSGSGALTEVQERRLAGKR